MSRDFINIRSWHHVRLLNWRRPPIDAHADSCVGKRSRRRTRATRGGLSVFGQCSLPGVIKEQETKADIASQAENVVSWIRTNGVAGKGRIRKTNSAPRTRCQVARLMRENQAMTGGPWRPSRASVGGQRSLRFSLVKPVMSRWCGPWKEANGGMRQDRRD